MRKILFAIGAVAMVLALAACDNAVTIDTERPGSPRDVEIRLVTVGAQQWAVLEWTAASNSQGFGIYRRRGNEQPQRIDSFGNMSRGVWTHTTEDGWQISSGPTTERWSWRERIDLESETMWRGLVEVGVRAQSRLGAAHVNSAPSGITWGGTVNLTGLGAGW